MKWILRLINLEGESVYSEAMDIHGNRRVCRKQQFAELGDLQGLKSQVGNLHEQYEITKLTLNRATADRKSVVRERV